MQMAECKVNESRRMIGFHAVASEDVEAIWPDVRQHCEAALVATFQDFNDEKILNLLINGNIKLIIITADDVIIASLTMEIVPTQSGKNCHVVTVGGKNMSEWVDQWLPTWIEIAREQGCESITLKGREGWARYARRYGFKHEFTQMKLNIIEDL